MMRVCHLDTCPVGIATQNPELRARFTGKPEFVETFFEYIAEEVREHLAALGFRSHRGGRRPASSCSTPTAAVEHWKAAGLDLAPILTAVEPPDGGAAAPARRPRTTGWRRRSTTQLIALAPGRARATASRCASSSPVRNVNRTVGTMLGHEVTKALPATGLPDDTIDVTLTGLGRAVVRRVPARAASRCGCSATPTTTSARACPAAGSSSGPTARPRSPAEHNVIAGNVIGYGATTGEIFLRGLVGERFCVRNSGATAVVEGVGDHGCEYMTGGTVVVLGPTGRNFAAGMSGGVAYVLDLRPDRVNAELVDLLAAAAPSDETRRARAARAAPSSGPSRPSPRGCSQDWDQRADALHARPAARLPARPRRARRRRRDRGPRPRRRRGVGADHGGLPWLTRRAS